MLVLPKHASQPGHIRQVDAEAADRHRPLSSSREVSAPNYVVYKRNPDYWAKDLPIKRGFDNYDEIRVDYYRDANSMFEAFKTGASTRSTLRATRRSGTRPTTSRP